MRGPAFLRHMRSISRMRSTIETRPLSQIGLFLLVVSAALAVAEAHVPTHGALGGAAVVSLAAGIALVIAGAVAFPVNRWLITRGKGHAVLHETGVHGGPPVWLVTSIAAVAFVFGATVLLAELL